LTSKSTAIICKPSGEAGRGSAGSSLSTALGAYDLAQGPRLAGADLDQGLVRLQLDDQVADGEDVIDAAVPFQHPDLLDIFDRSRNGQCVDHEGLPGPLSPLTG
jgi:hypothetical protein